MNNSFIPKKLCIVHNDRFEIIKNDDICRENVGTKAYGLSAIPSNWTLPFLVISPKMYGTYIDCQNIELIKKLWYGSVINALYAMHFDLSKKLFLRSNMSSEGLDERGRYESYECCFETLFETIKVYFDHIKYLNVESEGVPILIQQYSQVTALGHVSNERRLSKEHRDWKGEVEQTDWNGTLIPLSKEFSISLRNWRRKIIINEHDSSFLNCSSLKNITRSLELPCAWATNQQLRIHFEWVFDGKYIYIVQADQEQDYGINPIVQFKAHYHSNKKFFIPKVLHLLSSEDRNKYSRYSKVCNPLIYSDLGLKTAPIYILDNKNEILKLINGEVSEQLASDLNDLASNHLVIRTDIEADDQISKQMLPRTDDVRNKNDAIDWLINKSRKLCLDCKDDLSFIFILHNFIPSISSAFAYAEPNNRNVLIESLWGLPEGLYYYTHDKHIVDTKHIDLSAVTISDISVAKKTINAKNNFIFSDANGKWIYNQVSPDYIWKLAILRESWLKEIAINTRRISEYVGTSISVMWFVGVDSNVYDCNVFPWYHEYFKYDTAARQANRKKHRNELSYAICKNTDIEKLRQTVQSDNRKNIKYLLLMPVENNMIRSKEFIKEVGEIACNLGAVVILEGGVLSHAYYQLKSTGAAIELKNPFDNIVSNVKHGKLVRDKIPNKIQSGGEIAIINKLSDNDLIEQLKIKLIEEAFEVLDAENTDDLIQELADVLEVVDSIIEKQKINKESVNTAKVRKKEKVGGFEDGIILEKTAISLYKSTDTPNDDLFLQNDNQITSWVDKKENPKYSEVINRLKIPIYLRQWSKEFTARSLSKGRPDIYVSIKGKRDKASLQLEVSISEGAEQLTIFDDLDT